MRPQTVRIDGPTSSLVVAAGYGPRITELLVDGRNAFASLPEDTLEAPGGPRYRMRGGHRLWAAPEVPAVTYQPDDSPCTVTPSDARLRVDATPDGAGLGKSISMTATSEGWTVDHEITNRSASTMTVGPWAITQLHPGGRATLGFDSAGAGLQADRALVFWPYTDPADPRLDLGEDGVQVDASPGPPLKVGVAGGPGWAEYAFEGVRMRTRIAVDPAADYPDRGASVQVYVHDRFCELETLGPLVELAPGASTTHREEWIIT
ncbi:MAG: hypothetical protein WD096_01895 [Actinomycetota bacterium]